MFGVGRAKRVEQLEDERRVAVVGLVDRQLGDIVAQDEQRVDSIHRLGPIGVGATFLAESGDVAIEPGIGLGPHIAGEGVRVVIGPEEWSNASVKVETVVSRDVREPSEEEGHVGLDLREELEQVVDEFGVALAVEFGDTELVAHHSTPVGVEHVDVGLECLLEWLDLADERIDRVGELGAVPLPDVWLRTESVALVFTVGGIRGPAGVVVLEPAVRAVVDRQTVNRHVVGVHHAVNEPDSLPMHDHLGSAFRDLTEPGDVVGGLEALRAAVGDLREMQRDRVVGQGLEQFVVVARHREFERAEPNE